MLFPRGRFIAGDGESFRAYGEAEVAFFQHPLAVCSYERQILGGQAEGDGTCLLRLQHHLLKGTQAAVPGCQPMRCLSLLPDKTGRKGILIEGLFSLLLVF